MKKALWIYATLGVVLLLLAGSAGATTLGPGGSVPGPGDGFSPGQFTPVAWTGDNPPYYTGTQNPYTLSGGAGTGFWGELVWSDPVNLFCKGCLDFLYQVYVSSGSIDTVSMTDFAGSKTDVGHYFDYLTSLYNAFGPFTTLSATTISRDYTGDITFQFESVPSGQGTYLMMIETDATSFTPGTFSIGGGTAAAEYADWGPATVPEPATLSMLGLGLLGLLGISQALRDEAELKQP